MADSVGIPVTYEDIDSKLLLKYAEAFQISTELKIRLEEIQETVVALLDGQPIRDETKEMQVRQYFAKYKDYLTQIDEQRVAAKEPILAAGRLIDARAKLYSTPAEASKNLLDTALTEWRNYLTEEARKTQQRLQAEHDKKQAKSDKKAEETGKPAKPVPPAPSIQTPAKSVVVNVGDKAVTQVYIDQWKWKLPSISDPSTLTADRATEFGIPLKLFKLDCGILDKLARAMKSTDPLPGSKIEGFNDGYWR